jgi:hypothetical protein
MRLRDAERNWQRIGRGIWQQHVQPPIFGFITKMIGLIIDIIAYGSWLCLLQGQRPRMVLP